MPLAKTFGQYARFTVLMTPVIIPVFAVLSSTFNKNIHGIVFVFLLAAVCLLVSFIGGWGAPPSTQAGPACYIFGGGGLGGWMGQAGNNSPDWHALILSFSCPLDVPRCLHPRQSAASVCQRSRCNMGMGRRCRHWYGGVSCHAYDRGYVRSPIVNNILQPKRES